MKKFWGLVVLGVVACGSYGEDIGTSVASMSAMDGSGWRDEDGWEHRPCDIGNANHVCYWPAARTDGQGPWRRLVNMPLTDSGLPAGVTAATSRNSAMSMLMNQTADWNLVTTTQGVGSNYRIVRDDSIFTGTPPNTNILLSSIAHIQCTDYGVELDHPFAGSANTCDQVTLSLDVGAFTAWVNQWTTNTNTKQNVLTSIFLHGAGVATGIGASDSATTAMRRTLSKTSTPIQLSNYDACQADQIWYTDPDYTDPEFGLYENVCP